MRLSTELLDVPECHAPYIDEPTVHLVQMPFGMPMETIVCTKGPPHHTLPTTFDQESGLQLVAPGGGGGGGLATL